MIEPQFPPRKPKPADYTQDQHDRLVAMAAAGATGPQIAAAIGRSAASVYDHAAHFRVSLGKRRASSNHYTAWSSEDVGRLRMLARNHSRAEAAALLGRTLRSITWAAGEHRISFRRYGMRAPFARYPPDVLRRIVAMQEAGHSARETAQELGISRDYVTRIRARSFRWRETLQMESAP